MALLGGILIGKHLAKKKDKKSHKCENKQEQRIAYLEQRLARLEGQQGGPRHAHGPSGCHNHGPMRGNCNGARGFDSININLGGRTFQNPQHSMYAPFRGNGFF